MQLNFLSVLNRLHWVWYVAHDKCCCYTIIDVHTVRYDPVRWRIRITLEMAALERFRLAEMTFTEH